MRFRTIDGLRGIAAMAVVLFHLNEATVLTYGPWVHRSIASLLAHGYLGVDVFFVISGFVIAYSVRNADLSLGFVGRVEYRHVEVSDSGREFAPRRRTARWCPPVRKPRVMVFPSTFLL